MKIKNLPHLEAVIETKDNEIGNLKRKIEKLEREKETSLDTWQLPKYIPSNDFRKDLPVPRLEMIYEKVDYYGSKWTYGIVRQAHPGMRGEWDDNVYVFIPFSQTTSTSNGIDLMEGGKLRLPFRDSSHIKYDKISLKMPAYITCPEQRVYNEIHASEDFDIQFNEDVSKLKEIKN